MANRAYFLNHGLDRPTTAGEMSGISLLGANYQLPILWLALFEVADLTYTQVPCSNSSGEEVIENILTCFAKTEKATRSYNARRGRLSAAIGADGATCIAEWEVFMSSQLSSAMVQLDLTELWMMYDSAADFEAEVRGWISCFENFSGPDWESLCAQACVADPDVRRYGLRGFPWEAVLEWS